MVRHYTKRRSYTTCTCGQVMYGQISPTHYQSTRHRYGHQIVERLENGETLLEVGKSLGITRERVRQLARALGVKDASMRTAERSAQKALTKFFDRLPHTRLGRLLEAATQQGCSNQLVPLNNARYIGQYHHDRAWINGKLVVTRAGHARDGGWVSIRYPKAEEVDYWAFELPDGRWLFTAPYHRTRGKCTMFAPYEVRYGSKGYTYTKNHDFREGIEAWHLLQNGN